MSTPPRRYRGERSPSSPPRRGSAVEGLVAALAVVLLVLVLGPLLPGPSYVAPVVAAVLVTAGLLVARRRRRR
ncbi:hypothetical protein WDZ16_00265 [Pseudokineococcus marinus]|uniref:Uncharacterized protein n=1 Tax=Pseudokineococcus marinus TaxID=351215 RepID=A0A849BSV0_9ACTN|nr:hypothetical protein [Pseudokineococcus marinus]NNH23892.1 hypothetical protein [Pseudokineococcus marinus]